MVSRALGILLGVVVSAAIIVGVLITWFGFFPAVGITSDVDLEIVSTAGHTIWDADERLAMVEVARGNDSVEIIGFNLIFVVGGKEVRHFIEGDLDANSAEIYYVDLSGHDGKLEEILLAPVFVGGKEGKVSSRFKVNDRWRFENVSEIEGIVEPNGGSGGGGGGSPGSSEGELVSCDSELVIATCGDRVCGDMVNNCGDVVDCGSCTSDYLCQEGYCIPMFTDVVFVDKTLEDCLDTYSFIERECGVGNDTSYDTVQEALDIIQPGEKIVIMGSVDENSGDAIYNVTCNGVALINSGTSSSRIIVESYPGHYVQIHGTGGGGCDAIDFDSGGPNYYTIRGIHFDNFNKGAEGSVDVRKEGLIIEDCEFSNFADRGLILRNVHDSIFRNLYIHHSYEAGFIGAALCNNLTLINVESSYNDDGKGSSGDADGFAFSGGNGNITMINCTAIDNGEDGLDVAGENFKVVNFYASGGDACGIKLWRRAGDYKTNYTLINVIVKDYNQVGIKITADAANAPSGDYNVQIYNSLFYGNGENGIVFNVGREDINSKAEIYNTIIANNGYGNPEENYAYKYSSFYVSPAAAPYWDITSDYNLFYNNWDGDVAWSGEGSNSLLGVDPQFFAPEVGDFHLKGGGSAIDSGINIPSVSFDYYGQQRPIDGDSDGNAEWDIGPSEKYDVLGNNGPGFTYSGQASFEVYENELMQVQFSALDPDGDELRYLLLDGDILNEMSIDNTGKFSFTPNNDRSNSTSNNIYTVTIGVTDEHYYYPPAKFNISITVLDVNRAPTYAGSEYYSFIEGRRGRIKLSIEDLDGDTNLDSILINAPDSLSYNGSTFILDWLPENEDIGAYEVKLNISDGVDISNYTIVLEVLPLEPYQEPTDENNIFYVDGSSGNNDNDGQTEGTAWQTIQKAKNTLTAGQMVLIKGGTYNEYGSISRSGTPDAPIIFKAYSGEKVIMDGTEWSSPEAFRIYSSNLVIDGLTFVNFSETLFISGVYENITLINLNITNARSYGIYDWGVKNLRVENVVMDGVGDRGINLGSAINVHIYNVSIRDFEDRGISIGGSSADNINIINSKIYDSKEMGYFSILIAGKNAYIEGIRILNTSGITTYLYPDYLYMANSVVSDTRFRGSESFQMLLGDRNSKETEVELYNNIIYGGENYGIYIRNYVVHSILKNNIIYGNPNEIKLPVDSFVEEDYNIFGSGFVPVGDHSFNADPLFVDADNYDFSLQGGSPAIDAGVNVGVDEDIEDNFRPIGSGFDIGAYEYS